MNLRAVEYLIALFSKDPSASSVRFVGKLTAHRDALLRKAKVADHAGE